MQAHSRSVVTQYYVIGILGGVGKESLLENATLASKHFKKKNCKAISFRKFVFPS